MAGRPTGSAGADGWRACRLSGWAGLGLVFGLALAGPAAWAGSAIPGRNGPLDRLAFAVDGAESSHGADLRMWRPELDGPQGPMQVSAAAAADVGGGDRFDTSENRALGRAYLARLYRRYASWGDAVAAYNWGPGRMDAWIGRGRPVDTLPAAVEGYRLRVLTGASLPAGALGPARFGPARFGPARFGYVHAQPRRSLADRRHPSHDSRAVEQLYGAIMRASGP